MLNTTAKTDPTVPLGVILLQNDVYTQTGAYGHAPNAAVSVLQLTGMYALASQILDESVRSLVLDSVVKALGDQFILLRGTKQQGPPRPANFCGLLLESLSTFAGTPLRLTLAQQELIEQQLLACLEAGRITEAQYNQAVSEAKGAGKPAGGSGLPRI